MIQIGFFSLVAFMIAILYAAFATALFIRMPTKYRLGLLLITILLLVVAGSDVFLREEADSIQANVLRFVTGGRTLGRKVGHIITGALLATLTLIYVWFLDIRQLSARRKAKRK